MTLPESSWVPDAVAEARPVCRLVAPVLITLVMFMLIGSVFWFIISVGSTPDADFTPGSSDEVLEVQESTHELDDLVLDDNSRRDKPARLDAAPDFSSLEDSRDTGSEAGRANEEQADPAAVTPEHLLEMDAHTATPGLVLRKAADIMPPASDIEDEAADDARYQVTVTIKRDTGDTR